MTAATIGALIVVLALLLDAALVLLERTTTDEKYEPARSEHDWSTSLPR